MQAKLANDTLKATTLIRITAVAWFFAKMMSWRLWLADRIFPIVSPIGFLNNAPPQLHLSLLIFSLGLLFALILYPGKKILAVFLFTIEIAACILDQLRWQPWEYQYLLTLSFFLLLKSDKDFIKSISLLLAATYLFSGIFKFNGGFLHNIWDNMILRKLFGFSEIVIVNPLVHNSGLVLPLIEITTGAGLLLMRRKKNFVWLAAIIHVFLLLALGPAGLQKNSVVWPWNVAMIALVFTVFYNSQDKGITHNFFKIKANAVVILAVAVLPLFNFIGLWPAYLSFKLYSGNPELLAICIKNTDDNPKLEPFVVNVKSLYCGGFKSINAAKWTLEELNVPVYPEESYYKKLKKSWIRKFPKTETHFMIFHYPSKPENIKEIP